MIVLFKRICFYAAIVIAATLLWIPCLHLFFKPDIGIFVRTAGVAPRAAELSRRHLELWSNPALRARELDRMRVQNPEWDFMSRTYFALALANMALADSAYRQSAMAILDTIIHATLEIERAEGQYHFLLDYGKAGAWSSDPRYRSRRSIFVDGEIALMLAARRFVREDSSYKRELTSRVELMQAQMSGSPVLCGESYPNECWLFCNTVALAAIRLSDVLDSTDHTGFIRAWVACAKQKLLDPNTGLLISAFEVDGTSQAVGACPEGSSIWMACHMLQIADPAFARDQYTRACKELRRSFIGFGYSMEWPKSCPGGDDIDSGPIIPVLKISASASGMAIMAARAFNDTAYLRQLLTSLEFAGFPIKKNNTLRYQASNPVGDAVLLYSLVQGPLWAKAMKEPGYGQ